MSLSAAPLGEESVGAPPHGEGTGRGGAVAARVRVKGTFEPARVVVPAGTPARLVFRREDTDPCSERVVFPDYQWVADLEPFRDTVVELPARGPGEHEFTCAQGRMRGTLVVTLRAGQARRGGPGIRSPLIAAALSLLLPGFGHFLIRSWLRGAIWLAGWFVVGAAGGVPHGPAVVLLMLTAAVDAYVLAWARLAERADDPGRPDGGPGGGPA